MTFKEKHESLTESEFLSLVENTFPLKWVNSVLIKYDEPKIRKSNYKSSPSIHLFTETNEYIISMKGVERRQTSDESTYLGCIAVSRKERAGEDYRRSNDLAHGPCTEATWDIILKHIVMYELVKIHKERESFSVRKRKFLC